MAAAGSVAWKGPHSARRRKGFRLGTDPGEMASFGALGVSCLVVTATTSVLSYGKPFYYLLRNVDLYFIIKDILITKNYIRYLISYIRYLISHIRYLL